MAPVTVLVLVVLAHGLVSARLRSTPITGPMIFVVVGVLTGPELFDLATIELDSEEVIVLAEATLALVLFSDAVRIDASMVRAHIGIPARMLGLGLPLVVGTGTIVAQLFLDVSWAEAALLGSILAATDAALGQAVLTDESVPLRIRSSLNVESGLNDGLALPAVTLFTAISLAEERSESTSFWVRFIAEQIGLGVLAGLAVGLGGGWLLIRLWRAGWVDGIGGQLAALALVGLAFVVAHELGGNTFIAAFVAGLGFRAVGADDAEHLGEYGEDSGRLLASITFVVFGNALLGPVLGDITVPIAVCVVILLTAGRMAPIALSLLGTGLRWPTLAFLGWFGPRGLASVLFALTVLDETRLTPDDDLFVVVAWTVFVSVLLHGATASWGAQRYGRWYRQHRATVHGPVSEEARDDSDPHPRVRWDPSGAG